MVTKLSVALSLGLSFAIVGCASDDSSQSQDEQNDVEASAADLVGTPGPGCRWVLRPGTFCPAVVGAEGPTCAPAPRHPGFHWEKICTDPCKHHICWTGSHCEAKESNGTVAPVCVAEH
jgi:hypothetical protein